MIFYTNLKSMFAEACIISSCNPAPVDGVAVAGQQDLFSEVFHVSMLHFWIFVIFIDHIVIYIFR
jgi:hypothetical protein